MFRTTVKTALVAGVAALALTACGPVKMGSAVIIGDERITTASLDRTVQEWNEQFRASPEANMKRTGSATPGQQRLPMDAVSDSQMRDALTRIVRIRISDEVARQERIDVPADQIDQVIDQSGGPREAESTTLAMGLPGRYTRDLIRDQLIQLTLLRRHGFDGVEGSPAARQAQQRAIAVYTDVVRRLGVKVNPRYGDFDTAQLMVAPVTYRLSRGETGTGLLPGNTG
ncbi:hypothetical protein SAMN04489712_105372 [Thermomonospora echinospora]|uniref:SurA N-terminal domain-containing protein n=1 Tax=Thermomonospora echinospora TaxID=1992 RepID=A0A1H6ADZ1_9ACTN|nr:hypothetical protein [Thermomonospora echinospora]SEG46592.1 hypothetical protein SAMN04489712_105372 [Thermomonospora echinospora]